MRKIYVFICTVVFVFHGTVLVAQGRWGEPRNLTELNTPADEFAPTFEPIDRLLAFCSTVSGRSHVYSEPTNSAPLQMLRGLSQDARTQISYLNYSQTGERVYSRFRTGEHGSVLNICSSILSNNIWGPGEFIESLLSDRFSAHASLSPDGKLMVFASDREGGEGGTDLWMATKSANTWNAPVNLGESLNSVANEITPYLASSDTLYFASNGFGGRGGFEVFMTTLVAGEWQPPVPLEDCNTAYDESDFIVLPDGDAVFASNRPGGKGGLDLYRMKRRK